MRWFLVTFGILPILSACVGQPVVGANAEEPKPVLILSEWIDWGGIGHPWPIELRLVAYDNGLVIQQPVKGDEPLTKPRFVWQQKTPAEVFALAAEMKAASLEGVEITDESVPLPIHMGWTNFEYWDADKSELVKLVAYGMPCIAKDRDGPDQWAAITRSATDPRFLKLCDMLLGLQSPQAKEWYPKEMTATLLAVDEPPGKTVAWPNDWPADWQPTSSVDGTQVEFCVPVGQQPDGLTAEILDPQSEAWSQTIAVAQTGSLWWTVSPHAARVSMPGRIGLLANGPCSVAR